MIGETVGNFQVVGRLGEGGMGEVLLAEHKEIHTKVAIKVLRSQISADRQHVQRFFNEAVAVSKIKHAGIAKIFDVGFHKRGEAYLVMEFLDGESLAGRIARSGRVPIEQAADIARQIASVLDATHAAGITHRDLKPDNVFLVPDAELASGERVKVLDFGIAKLGASGMTRTGGPMGTPTYMPPEQWRNTATVDSRADLYALGCLVFEMICGRPPFVSDSMAELCNLHLNVVPPAMSRFVGDLPPSLDELVSRLLSKDVEGRPSLAHAKAVFAELARDFRGVAAETLLPDGSMPAFAIAPLATAPPPTTLGRSAMPLAVTPGPRRRWPLVVAFAAIAAGAIAVTTFARSRGASAPPVESAAAPPPPAPVVETPPLAPPPVGTSQVRIETSPADATVAIDGVLVANPFDGAFAPDEVRRRIDVRAPGYKPSSRWIAFDRNQTLLIALEREERKPSRTTPPLAKRREPPPVPVPVPSTPVAPAKQEVVPSKGYQGTKGTIITDYPPH